MNREFTSVQPQIDRIVSRLKQFGNDSLDQKGGVSGLKIGSAAHALVNDLERYPHAYVLAGVYWERARNVCRSLIPRHFG